MVNPYTERRAQMFPVLSAAQIDRIAAYGRRTQTEVGQLLFDVGEQHSCFHVVIEGSVEVVRPVRDREEPVVVHGPGQFTGEINMLSARRSLVRSRVTVAGWIVTLDRDVLRVLVKRDAELSEILMRAFILRRLGLVAENDADLILIGSRHSATTQQLREFLTRNGQPFNFHDVEHDLDVAALLERFHVSPSEVPVVLCGAGRVLRSPSIEALASVLGLRAELDPGVVRDVIIVGAGPAGLAAAVYAASEGLDALVLESSAPGGQAGTSSRIENYLGFPTGISGQALAGRALNQAEKFGAEVAIGRTAVRIECDSRPYRVSLSNGEVVQTKTIVIASGVRYRTLELPAIARFEGLGVYYSATHLEAQQCDGQEAAIVGGANSAGQAAVFLAQRASHVYMLVRGAGLSESMSRYLIDRIENTANITLLTHTQIELLEGEEHLQRIRWRCHTTHASETRAIGNLFLMTGADPNSAWLQGCVLMDDKQFVKTGGDLHADELSAAGWPLSRRPYLLETSIPAVFAAGDIRSGSVKRVASGVGEGAICVQLVHKVLQET